MHLGPTAENFYQLFSCGDSHKHIAPSDLAAVSLAAIQALCQENKELRLRLNKQETAINELKADIYSIIKNIGGNEK